MPLKKSDVEHVFSPSQLDTFTSCRRKYYWSYVRGIVPRARNWNLIGGTLIHTALEHYYRTEGDQKVAYKAATKQAAEETAKGFMSVEDEFERDRFLAMIAGLLPAYAEHYKKDKFNVLGIESKFDLVRIEGYFFKGIVDLILTAGKSGVFIMDHKSASRLTPGILAAMPLKYQSIIYPTVASSIAGKTVSKIVYNYFTKPGMYQGKKETCGEFLRRLTAGIIENPAKYFYREEVRVGPNRAQTLLVNVREVCKDITACLNQSKTARWYRCPMSCSMFGKSCEYLPLCMDGEKKSVTAGFVPKEAHWNA